MCSRRISIYLLRDFDSPTAQDTTLHLSDAGGWTAWLDGKIVGRDLLADEYRLEADRLPVQLAAGRHRLLIKLELPPEGAVPFHARFSTQPHLAMQALLAALTVRQFQFGSWDRIQEFNQVRGSAERRLSAPALLRLAQSLALLSDDQHWVPVEELNWASALLHDMKEDAPAASASALRDALHTLEDYGERRTDTLLSLSRAAAARALISQGSLAQADELLRDFSERYPVPARDAAPSWAWRGALRCELGQGPDALPFFERCARVSRLPGTSNRSLKTD